MFCHRKATNAFFCLLVSLLLLPSLLSAEPHRLFGDNGTYVWAASDPWLHDIFSLNDGRALLTWSENQPTDGFRQVYRQILDSQGAVIFNPPQVISDNSFFTTPGATGKDVAGNSIVAWIATSPDDSTTGMVMAQKYDLDGNPQWGQESREIHELSIDLTPASNSLNGNRNWEFVFPNNDDGVYFISRHGLFSIDADGNLADEWQWHEEQMSSNTTLFNAFADGDGGFWISVYVEDAEDNSFRYNHYFSDGERLWDNPQKFSLEGEPEEIPDLYLKKSVGWRGGLITLYSDPETDDEGICVIDGNGDLLGDEYIHFTESRVREVCWLSDGSLFLVSGRDVLNSAVYDPENNEFVRSENGFVIAPNVAQSYTLRPPVDVGDNEGVIIPFYVRLEDQNNPDYNHYQTWFQKVNLDGELQWGQPAIVESVSNQFITPDGQGGFWQGGAIYNCGTLSNLATFPCKFNRFDSDGERFIPDGVNPGPIDREGYRIVFAWQDPDNCYRHIIDTGKALVLQSLEYEGGIIGDPEGVELMRYPGQRRGASVGMLAGDQIVVVTNGYGDDGRGALEVRAYDQMANELWCLPIEDELIPTGSNFEPAVSPDGRILFITVQQFTDEGVTYHLFAVDLQQGNLDWHSRVGSILKDNVGVTRYFSDVTLIDGTAYFQYGKLNGSTYVAQIVAEGQVLSQTDITGYLSSRDTSPIGIVPAVDVGLWVGLVGEGTAWLRYLDGNGRVTNDSIPLFPGIDIDLRRINRAEYFDLFEHEDKIWFTVKNYYIAEGNHEMNPIQAVLPNRSLLFDRDDMQFDLPESVSSSEFMAMPCENGNMYLNWHYYIEQEDGREQHNYVTLINSEGEFVEGWDSEGFSPYQDGNICLDKMFSARDEGLLVYRQLNNTNISLQHISNEPRQDMAVAPNLTPSTFEVTSVSPNPFNGATTIGYTLQKAGVLSIKLFDVEGREVYQRQYNAGSGSGVLSINMDNFSSGLYFARLENDGVSITRNLMLLK